MRALSISILVAAAAVAAAQDAGPDPDLAVLSGRVAHEAPGEVRVKVHHVVARAGGAEQLAHERPEQRLAAGQEFQYAGLAPGTYSLEIRCEGCPEESRRIDVFADVANVEVRPAKTPASEQATVTGKLTLGFDCALADCRVRFLSGPIEMAVWGSWIEPDGSFAVDGLPPGAAWAIIDYERGRDAAFRASSGGPRRSRPRTDPNAVVYRRFVPLTLKAGANPIELRLDTDEEVSAVIRSSTAGESVEGRVVDLDPTPYSPRTRAFRFDWPKEGPPRCSRWVPVEGISTFAPAGAELPLFTWAKGLHRVRVEAAGFEPLEQEVTIAGTTRVELTLKPLAGDYVRPSVEGDAWWIEERGADGDWKPIASWESRWRPKDEAPPPVPILFLTPGEHVLRAVRVGSAPSAPQKVQAGEGRVERGLAFVFPEGRTLRGSLRTSKGDRLYGFRAYCFSRIDEKLERERGHDFVAGLDFVVTGLTKGRHVLAFDEKGEHPFAEFDMGEKDVTREFVYKAR